MLAKESVYLELCDVDFAFVLRVLLHAGVLRR